MYSGTEPVLAFKLPRDKHARELLCEHSALRALKYQVVHGAICMLILLLFSAHPYMRLCKEDHAPVMENLCVLPFSTGIS